MKGGDDMKLKRTTSIAELEILSDIRCKEENKVELMLELYENDGQALLLSSTRLMYAKQFDTIWAILLGQFPSPQSILLGFTGKRRTGLSLNNSRRTVNVYAMFGNVKSVQLLELRNSLAIDGETTLIDAINILVTSAKRFNFSENDEEMFIAACKEIESILI